MITGCRIKWINTDFRLYAFKDRDAGSGLNPLIADQTSAILQVMISANLQLNNVSSARPCPDRMISSGCHSDGQGTIIRVTVSW